MLSLIQTTNTVGNDFHNLFNIHTHIYTFKDPSSEQVGLNVEFTMKRVEMQYAFKSKQ